MSHNIPENVVDDIVDSITNDFPNESIHELVDLLSKEYPDISLNADNLQALIDEQELGQCSECDSWEKSSNMHHGICHLCMSDTSDAEEDDDLPKFKPPREY